MKKMYFILLVLLVTSNGLFSQNSGFSVRALTVAERDAMVKPAEGTKVLCSDCSTDGKTIISIYINGQWMNMTGCIFPPVPGTHIATQTQITWNWSAVFGANGYLWNMVNDLNTAVDIGLVTTKTEMGLTPGTTYTRYIWAYNYCCGESDPAILTQTTLTSTNLTASISAQTNVSCFGGNNGSATATATGGTPGYTYLWSNGQTTSTATSLGQGTYTVTVKDSQNLTATATATIIQPGAPLTAMASATPVNCGGNNGTASVTATGGSGGYSYKWNDPAGQTTSTATGLIAGTYTVTVTDSQGCMAISTAQVTQPNPLTASATATHVSCFGGNNGSVTVTAQGGTQPYGFNWNTTPVQTTQTANGLSGGTYTVTVTDNKGCTATGSQTVTIPIEMLQLELRSVAPLCAGGNNGTAGITVTGGTTPYSYKWSTNPQQFTQNAVGLMAGNYTVTVSDAHACTLTATVTVTEPGPLVVQKSSTPVSCFGGNNGSSTVTVTGGTPGYAYLWSNGQTTSTATGLGQGSFTVTVTDSHSCTVTTTATITQPASSFTINHVAGAVAPVTKTVTYGTVTNIPGAETKCWITSNLGADHQATAVNDATEPSAGWYWQFNRKQGYKHDGATLTPAWTVQNISENSDWTATNDPCTIELGTGWRIPTLTEWTNVDATGGWTDWNGPWNSGLKMHAAGLLDNLGGSLLNRGSAGTYWSSSQTDPINGWYLAFVSSLSQMNSFDKAIGMPLRCLKD